MRGAGGEYSAALLRRNDQACNSPDCFVTATGLAKSFANCLRTAGSRLESSRANSSSSKGKSEKAEAGLRHAHLRRIHSRKRSNICRLVHCSQSGVIERHQPQTVPARRHRPGNFLDLHRRCNLLADFACHRRPIAAASYRAGSITLQLVRPDIRQSCILLADVSS
jgi:hypothetical protein